MTPGPAPGASSAGKVERLHPVERIPLAEYELFTGTDLDGLRTAVAEHFVPHELSVLADGPFTGCYRGHPNGTVSLYVLGYGADVRIMLEEFDESYFVGIPLSGRFWLTAGAQRAAVAAGLGGVIGPQQRVSMRWSCDSVNLVVRIARPAIDRALRDHVGEEAEEPLRFASLLDGANPASRQWVRLVGLLADEIDHGALLASPLAARQFEQLVVNGLLYAQPHGSSGLLPGRRHGLATRALRRAMRYCEEHAADPITVAGIAAAARTSVRTIQEEFRRHEGTTPMGYVRRVRLDHARADLVAMARGRRTEGTVADVAHRWGFAHQGRFAQAYRDAYGELPSQTLRAD